MKSAIELRAIRYVEKPIAPQELYQALKDAVKELERENMVRNLANQNELMRQELSLKLTEPEWEEEVWRERLRLVCPKFLQQEKYRTVLLRQEGGGPILGEEYRAVSDKITSVFGPNLAAHAGKHHLLFQLSASYLDNVLLFQNRLHELLRQIRTVLPEGISCFLASGECVSSLKDLHRSYETALQAEKAVFITGYDTCVLYSEDKMKAYVLQENDMETFELFLRNGNRTEAFGVLENTAKEISEKPATDEGYVRYILYQFAKKICHVSKERGITEASENLCQSTLRQHFFSDCLFTELYETLCRLLEHYFTEWEEMCRNRPVYLIKQCLEQRFWEKELSIQNVADLIHLTPSHICHIFKKETGQTVNQYLTVLRIEKAKVLLQRPDVRMASITEQVGYADANYFTRQFKKQTGKTPSEYRDAYLKSGG